MTAIDEAAREAKREFRHWLDCAVLVTGQTTNQQRPPEEVADKAAEIFGRHLVPPGDAEAAAQKRLDEITPTVEEWKEIVAESVVPPEVYAVMRTAPASVNASCRSMYVQERTRT